MIDNICTYLTNRMKLKMPEIDQERLEILDYGLHLIIGEIPKIGIMIILACLLGVGELTALTFLLLLPYRMFSGGFHLKTHIGCILGTTTFYSGIALCAKYIMLPNIVKYIGIVILAILGFWMITKYAPADTENAPIISKAERKKKKIVSYITFGISLLVCLCIPSTIISNILLFGLFVQSICISRFAYRITNSKYGFEEYEKGNLKI